MNNLRQIIVCITGLDKECVAIRYYLIQDIGQLAHCIYDYELSFVTQIISIDVNPSLYKEQAMKDYGYSNFQDLERYPIEFEGYIGEP